MALCLVLNLRHSTKINRASAGKLKRPDLSKGAFLLVLKDD
jgi:hypothetical protein